MGGSVDCSNGGSYGSWFMPTAVRLDCSDGVLYGSWFMPTAVRWIGPMVFCMDFGLCQRRFVWIVPTVVRMDLGLCQRLRFGSVDWSNGVLYGSWFMPTAEVWFGWIGPMVVCFYHAFNFCKWLFARIESWKH
jgi:hypothetical protein